jgi:formiminoglutamate deiminase
MTARRGPVAAPLAAGCCHHVSVNDVRRWHAELAWLGSGAPGTGGPGREGVIGDAVARDVLIEAAGERFTAVTPGVPASGLAPEVIRLPGLTLPGLANAHSHAFHRALRGLTAPGNARGTFWTWRERMYQVASRLTPQGYYELARAVYAEMALAGITCVGEFHYLHHAPGGRPYSDPNEPGRLLIAAASAAGIRITLLDTCYLASGFAPGGAALPLEGVQARFGDGSAAGWAARMAGFGCDPRGMVAPHARLGAAIHSVRAVPPGQMPQIMAWAHAHDAPVHAHLSEQPRENEECLAAFGSTPAQVLSGAGVLGPRSTVVHATHLTPSDVSLLGAAGVTACLCPVTEADLADGVGPSPELAAAGCGLSLGSDGHSVIDLLEEARWLELSQRYVTRRRGHFTPGELAVIATKQGHACLGWPDAGAITPGGYADLVTVPLDTPRLAGAGPGVLGRVFAAGTAADVRHVVVSGKDVVRDGRHLLAGDVGAALSAAIAAVTR